MTLPLGSSHPRTPAYIYDCWRTTEPALIAGMAALQKGLAPGMTFSEFEDQVKADAEHEACFAMIAATEAWLMIDFERRRSGATNDTTMQVKFTALQSRADGENRSLRIGEICRAWQLQASINDRGSIVTLLDDFLALIDFRNWIAHGRRDLGAVMPSLVEILSVYTLSTELPRVLRQWRLGFKQSLECRWPPA